MPFKPGNKLGKGRPRGSKNKYTKAKEDFLKAFEKLGGSKGLVKWAQKSPRNQGLFYQLLTRLLPAAKAYEDHTLSGGELKFDFSDNGLEVKVVHVSSEGKPYPDVGPVEIKDLPTSDIEKAVRELEERKKQLKKGTAGLIN